VEKGLHAPEIGGVKYLYKVYCRIKWGEVASCTRTRCVIYLYKVYCRMHWGEGASCPGNKGSNIYIKCIVEYIEEKGLHAPRLGL
jgi:hypothetical protein